MNSLMNEWMNQWMNEWINILVGSEGRRRGWQQWDDQGGAAGTRKNEVILYFWDKRKLQAQIILTKKLYLFSSWTVRK